MGRRVELCIDATEPDILGPEREELAAVLVSLGGKFLAVHPGFTVPADPEGNELCLTLG